MELFLLVFLFVIYFLPAIVAFNRNHQSQGAVLVLNLFLGWTLLGWVAAFVWAFTKPAQAQVIVKSEASKITHGVADEIQKLAALKEQGLLTDEEFSKRKQKILGSF